jgi:hypothetical protein
MSSQPQVGLALRIMVEQPLAGVALALQHGKDTLEPPTVSSPALVMFDLVVRLGAPQADGRPRFLGPYAQGPAAARFVYVCVGRRAGQADTPWDRRAKVPLGGITPAQVKAVLAVPGKRLAVRFPGRGADGGPTCATVRLAPNAWQLVDDKSAE